MRIGRLAAATAALAGEIAWRLVGGPLVPASRLGSWRLDTSGHLPHQAQAAKVASI